MSNSDYHTVASLQPVAPLCLLQQAVSRFEMTFPIYALITTTTNDLQVGMGVLIDDEIMELMVITDSVLTFKRGCADTIPAPHEDEAIIWFIDGFLGTDTTPYMGTEQLGIKIQMRTLTQSMDIAYSPPMALTMASRFARPYPVGQFEINGTTWDNVITMDFSTNMVLTWVERNRVVQSDQLIGHIEAGVAPEAGTTYRATFYTAGDSLVATHTGIVGTTWTYSFTDAIDDFNLDAFADTGLYPAYLTFETMRDGYPSWQAYRIDFEMNTAGLSANNHELREDGGTELREDGGTEIRG